MSLMYLTLVQCLQCWMINYFLFFFISEEFVPYDVTVRAANLRGCGEAETKICFTLEGGN